MTTENEIRKYLKLKNIFNNKCIEIIQLLSELDSPYYETWNKHIIETFNVEYYNAVGEEYIYIQSEEYHVGCGEYERHYSEFPLRYLLINKETIKIEVLSNKKKREKVKLEKEKELTTNKQKKQEESERKLLEKLMKKYNKIKE
jgi:hypothetical protein